METFKIDIDETDYHVTLREDKTYLIKNDLGNEFVIRADTDETGVVWTLIYGEVTQDLVNQVGELIEEFEM